MSKLFKLSSIAAASLALSAFNANAAVEIYNNEGTTFSADALLNIFYTTSSVEMTDDTGTTTVDRDQSRLRVGFLPNYVGFNFGKQVGDLKLGARTSFWVTLNDTDINRGAEGAGTRSGIDVRQFYGTISGDFGEVLIGKDFGLFNRSNILSDEILLGHGQVSDSGGLVDGGNVSFGNIATGYTYPFPKAQITYRTPDMGGFKLAVGIMDPSKVEAGSSEDLPRIETELTYSTTMDDGSFKAWFNGMVQSSERADGSDTDQNGIGYGANVKFGGVSLTASGFSSEGVGHVLGIDNFVADDNTEVDGYLVQASYTTGDNRFVVGYGKNEIEVDNGPKSEYENLGLAYFRTVAPGLIVVTEYNKTELGTEGSRAGEETDTLSIGVVLTF